jgi:hypothetical protein
VTWLASEGSLDVTARVFQAGNGIVAVCEGWCRGPTIQQMDDPVKLGPIVKEMIAAARKNSGMDGLELD